MKSLLKILFNRVHKKVTIVSSAVFVVIAAIVTAGGIHQARQTYQSNLKRKVTEFAVIGAAQGLEMFLDAIEGNHITIEELFDDNYQKISFEEFRATYVPHTDQYKISDDYIRLMMDRVVERDVDEYYRYHTAYDRSPFLNERALKIQEPFLKTENIDYAVLIDRNGYIPFHHRVNSQPLTGNLQIDTFGNRAKRIWRNTLGKTQVPGEISYSSYRRDTGIPYLNVNVPIMLDGRHWGVFLVGYKATEIDVAVGTLQRNAAILILVIVLVTVSIYSIFIVLSLKPLSVLLQGVQRIDQGDLEVFIPVESQDEIGYLSRAFNGMVSSIKAAEAQLKSYAEDLQVSNEKLADFNRTLTAKVEERTQDLYAKNVALEDTLEQLHETQHQLIIQEKMASLGNLVAGVAHEMNNPIGAIHSSADVANRGLQKIKTFLPSHQTPDTEKTNTKPLQRAVELLERNNRVIVTASERIANIVQSLRAFARLDEARRQKVNLHENIDTTLTLIHHEFRGEIDVIKKYGEVPLIHCYPSELNQVFMNLLRNATQAIERKGTIAITTSADEKHVYVRISDTGKGVSPEVLSKIFDPGFTTQGVGVGTGLGLSIVYNIVQKHNGDIKVESQVGRGTTFLLTLPIEQIS